MKLYDLTYSDEITPSGATREEIAGLVDRREDLHGCDTQPTDPETGGCRLAADPNAPCAFPFRAGYREKTLHLCNIDIDPTK